MSGIRTIVRPAQYAPRVFAYVYDGDRLILAGPPRLTDAEAIEAALEAYRAGPRRMRDEERVSYGCIDADRREARTVSSRIGGKSAAAWWGGR